MGLLDIFGWKKKEEKETMGLMQEILQYQSESRADGVDTDEIPTGHGPFGLCVTNPIPTKSVIGSHAYLAQLHTSDGRQVESNRLGSTSAKEVTSGMIDMYQITANGTKTIIYICPYHKRNSAKTPAGFKLV